MVVFGVFEVFFAESRTELLGKVARVDASDAKGRERADVPENRVLHAFRKLMQILVSQNEVQPVFSGLGQNRREDVRREVLKFVYV